MSKALEEIEDIDEQLTDVTIDLVAKLYAKNSTYKPQTALLHYQHLMDCKPCGPDQNDVQILYGENHHWICT